MKIPESYLHPLFYRESDYLDGSCFRRPDILDIPFKFDIAYSLGAAPDWVPWENKEESLPMLFLAWKSQETVLSALHERRNRSDAKPLMIKAVAWFMQALFWMNEKPVSGINDWKREVSILHRKPINVEERLEFIIQRPELYHAFIQLQQLFTEWNKLYYKAIIVDQK